MLAGLGRGPQLDHRLHQNPSNIPSAFVMSTAIFACFSGAALLAPDGQYLYLGGTLMSGLSMLFWMSFLNIFFQSQLIFQVERERGTCDTYRSQIIHIRFLMKYSGALFRSDFSFFL